MNREGTFLVNGSRNSKSEVRVSIATLITLAEEDVNKQPETGHYISRNAILKINKNIITALVSVLS